MLTLAELRNKFKEYAGDMSIDNTLVDSFINEMYTGGTFLSALPRQTLLDQYGVDVDVEELAYDDAKRFYYLEIDKANLFIFHSEQEPLLRRSSSTKIKFYFQEQKISYTVIYLSITKLVNTTDATILTPQHDYLLAILSAQKYCLTYNEADKAQALWAEFQTRLVETPQVVKQKFISYVAS